MTLGGLRYLLFSILGTSCVLAAITSCSSDSMKADERETDESYMGLLVEEEETPVESGPFDGVVHSIKSHLPPTSYSEFFRDTNDLQLTAARALGIAPMHSLDGIYDTSHNIVKVKTCDDFVVDDLTYSMPYLVPRAAALLHDIGHAFRDTIKARGGKEYRMIVTSLMRTHNSVKQLKRRNRAATDSSCHLYGTTFDISFARFDCRDSSFVISEQDLKAILAEVIQDKREHNYCYVIYERKRGCFHVTTR